MKEENYKCEAINIIPHFVLCQKNIFKSPKRQQLSKVHLNQTNEQKQNWKWK